VADDNLISQEVLPGGVYEGFYGHGGNETTRGMAPRDGLSIKLLDWLGTD